jgi:hypothetical protein
MLSRWFRARDVSLHADERPTFLDRHAPIDPPYSDTDDLTTASWLDPMNKPVFRIPPAVTEWWGLQAARARHRGEYDEKRDQTLASYEDRWPGIFDGRHRKPGRAS